MSPPSFFSSFSSHAFCKWLTSWDFVSTWYHHHSRFKVLFQTFTTSLATASHSCVGYSAARAVRRLPIRLVCMIHAGHLHTFCKLSVSSNRPAHTPDFKNLSRPFVWQAHVLNGTFFPFVAWSFASTSGKSQAEPDTSLRADAPTLTKEELFGEDTN